VLAAQPGLVGTQQEPPVLVPGTLGIHPSLHVEPTQVLAAQPGLVGTQTLLVAVQVGLVPPLTPEQTQAVELPTDGNEGELGLGSPASHNAPVKAVSAAEYVLAAGPQALVGQVTEAPEASLQPEALQA